MPKEVLKIEPLLLDVKQVCQLLNIAVSTFYGLLSSEKLGIIPLRGGGKKLLYSRHEVEQYVKASTQRGKFIKRSEWQIIRGDYLKD
jgi:excisionase family DNA binding protein